MNKKVLFCALMLFCSGFSQPNDPDNNLRGPGNVVITGKRNDVDGADNKIEGFDNLIRGD